MGFHPDDGNAAALWSHQQAEHKASSYENEIQERIEEIAEEEMDKGSVYFTDWLSEGYGYECMRDLTMVVVNLPHIKEPHTTQDMLDQHQDNINDARRRLMEDYIQYRQADQDLRDEVYAMLREEERDSYAET